MSRATIRDSNDWTAEDVTSLTRGLDSAQARDNHVLVIFTTGDEGKVDPAILRRLPFRFQLDAPDGRDIADVCREMLGGVPDGRILELLEGRTIAQVARFCNELSDAWMANGQGGRDLSFSGCIGVLNRIDGFTVGRGEVFDLPGQRAFCEHINSCVLPFLSQPEQSRMMRVGFPSSILLYGGPGCGKTYCSRFLGKFLKWKVVTLDSGNFTPMGVARAFKQARSCAPCVVIIDEIDAICGDRRNICYDALTCEEFLRVLDRASKDRILVLASTNFIDRVDEAVKRTGRLGVHIEIKPLGPEDALDFARASFKGIPVAEDFAIEEVARLLEGLSAADASAVLERSRALAVLEGAGCVSNAMVAKARQEAASKRDDRGQRRQRVGFI